MSAYPKAEQTRRKGGKKPPRRVARPGSTLKAQPKPMRGRSLTNARAVAWREQYLPLRAEFLAAHPDCEMNITTPAICPPYPHPATEIQHMIQVSLDPSIENLLDVEHWIPSCHDANTWSGVHPMEAQALGVEVTPRERDDRVAALRAMKEARGE